MNQKDRLHSFAHLNESQETLLKEMERKLNMETGEEIIVLAYKKKTDK